MDARLIKSIFILGLLIWLPLAGAKSKESCPFIPSDAEVNEFVRRLIVPLKRLHLVLADSRILVVEFRQRDVDFLALNGLGKGLPFQLQGTGLVEVVEAHLETFANGQSDVETPSGPLCHLKVPHFIDLLFARPVFVRPNEPHLLKLGLKASEFLDFKPTGTPCKPQKLKCDLVSEVQAASITALRDEF